MLKKIISHRKEQLEQEKSRLSLQEILKKAPSPHKNNFFKKALMQPGLSIIAEIKKASPSKGIIKEDFFPLEQGQAYVDSGADAISVLTENHYFLGSSDYLASIHENLPLPVLRKDFIFDPYQVYESYYLGADAILLIAAILSDNELKELSELADSLALDVLVEIHDLEELQRVQKLEPAIIGINNRNLNDFSVTIETSLKLKKHLPSDQIVISESGIFSSQETNPLKEAGFAGILVGEALMKTPDIKASIQDMKEG